MLDVDLGPALARFVLVFIALPIGLAALASIGIARSMRNSTRRLAVGTYIMLVCTLISPAPIVWGDDHLGLTSSQALEVYGALLWTVGAITSLGTLCGVMRQVLLLDFGLTLLAVLICGLALGGLGPAFSLALIPAVGTIEVVLVLCWLARRLSGVAAAIDWRWAAAVGVPSAGTVAAYVYLRGPQAFGAQDSAIDLVVSAVVLCLPVVALAGVRMKSDQLPV